jgi:hypothetical protein
VSGAETGRAITFAPAAAAALAEMGWTADEYQGRARLVVGVFGPQRPLLVAPLVEGRGCGAGLWPLLATDGRLCESLSAILGMQRAHPRLNLGAPRLQRERAREVVVGPDGRAAHALVDAQAAIHRLHRGPRGVGLVRQ